MGTLNWMSLLLYLFLGLLVLGVVAYYGINTWVISNETDKVIARKKQKIEFVRDNWVMAPAIIRYAKRVNGHRGNIIIDFEVEVQLDIVHFLPYFVMKLTAGRKAHVRVDPRSRENIVLLDSAETSVSN